jgi:hypothetical protein
MANIEVREVETVVGETSPAGDSTRVEKTLQLGADIDGVWVPFATVNQSQLDHFKQRQEAAGEAGSGESAGGAQQAGEQQAGEQQAAPDEQHDASEVSSQDKPSG